MCMYIYIYTHAYTHIYTLTSSLTFSPPALHPLRGWLAHSRAQRRLGRLFSWIRRCARSREVLPGCIRGGRGGRAGMSAARGFTLTVTVTRTH